MMFQPTVLRERIFAINAFKRIVVDYLLAGFFRAPPAVSESVKIVKATEGVLATGNDGAQA